VLLLWFCRERERERGRRKSRDKKIIKIRLKSNILKN
jgi:hypothetical protein